MLAERYPAIKDGKNHIWGFVWKDGKTIGIKQTRKLTMREDNGLTQSAIKLEIVDENDDIHKIDGVIVAQTPFAPWSNLRFDFAMVRWNWEGRTCYGEAQEATYDQFIRENIKR